MSKNRWALFLDIDDTQKIDGHKGIPTVQDSEATAALKRAVNNLSCNGDVLVAHATNGILSDVLKVKNCLANPHYVSSGASTQMHRSASGWELEEDEDFKALVRSSGFDSESALALGKKYPVLRALGKVHQSDVKASFQFREGVSLQERVEIYDEIKRYYQNQPDTGVFYVEGRENYYIDILPAVCTKGGNIDYIISKEGIASDRVIAIGNGNNDISMMRTEFLCVAVGNSVPELKNHIQSMSNSTERHFITNGQRAVGVLEALRHFGLTS